MHNKLFAILKGGTRQHTGWCCDVRASVAVCGSFLFFLHGLPENMENAEKKKGGKTFAFQARLQLQPLRANRFVSETAVCNNLKIGIDHIFPGAAKNNNSIKSFLFTVTIKVPYCHFFSLSLANFIIFTSSSPRSLSLCPDRVTPRQAAELASTHNGEKEFLFSFFFFPYYYSSRARSKFLTSSFFLPFLPWCG